MKRLYDKALMEQIAKVYGNEITFLSEFSKALLDIIREGLIRDGEVRLHRFGVFKLKWMKARNGVNPSTGEKILIQAMPRVIFTPAKMLKEMIEPEIPALIPLDELNQPVALQADIDTTKPVFADSAKAEIKSIADTASSVEIESPAASETAGDRTAAAAELTDHLASLATTGLANQESPATTPTRVIGNIQDEIEILEQVVDILKSDQLKSEAEVETEETTEQTNRSSQWLDASVVEKITELSELEYFRTASETKTDKVTSAAETVAEESGASAEPAVLEATLDIESGPATASPPPVAGEKERSGKTWLAIAAAFVLVFATVILFNRFSGNTQPPEQQLTNNQPATAEQAVQLASSEPVVQPVEEEIISEQITPVEPEVVAEAVVPETEVTAVEVPAEPVTAFTESPADQTREDVIVSEQNYEELKRATAEQDVFFSEIEYKLLNGDSLWRLAKTHYVNPFYWPHIYQANHQRILNPDRVKIGRVIMLPTLYGSPEQLTKKDKRNIAMGYYYNYLYHKKRGDPHAYYSLIGVDKFDPDLLIEYKEVIERSDVDNLAMLLE